MKATPINKRNGEGTEDTMYAHYGLQVCSYLQSVAIEGWRMTWGALLEGGVPAARSGVWAESRSGMDAVVGVCRRRREQELLSRETSAVERIGGLRATYYTLSRN